MCIHQPYRKMGLNQFHNQSYLHHTCSHAHSLHVQYTYRHFCQNWLKCVGTIHNITQFNRGGDRSDVIMWKSFNNNIQFNGTLIGLNCDNELKFSTSFILKVDVSTELFTCIARTHAHTRSRNFRLLFFLPWFLRSRLFVLHYRLIERNVANS